LNCSGAARHSKTLKTCSETKCLVFSKIKNDD
jgi:hypothetical protein